MMKIKNWKLAILSLVLVSFLTSLGFWQLRRADEKTALLDNYQHRTQLAAVNAKSLGSPNDWRFYQAKLEGKFDEAHTILLDNKIFNGKVGYEVYTPFTAKGMTGLILVDRGFIPLGISRDELPAVPKPAKGTVSIQGMLNTPPKSFSFGAMSDNGKIQWPLRVEYININEIAILLKDNVYPYVISLNPESPSALQVKWQIVSVDPNKNKGYAFQWFALALTLLVISVVLNRVPGNKKSRHKNTR
jgi:surfeit locus 1 family protein